MAKKSKVVQEVLESSEVLATEFKVTPTVGEGGSVYPIEYNEEGEVVPHEIYDDRMAYVVLPDEGMKASSITVDGEELYEKEFDVDEETGQIKIDPETGGYMLKDTEVKVADSHENIFKLFDIDKDIEVGVEYSEVPTVKVTATIEGSGELVSNYSIEMDAKNAELVAVGEEAVEYDPKEILVEKGKSTTVYAYPSLGYKFSHYEWTETEGEEEVTKKWPHPSIDLMYLEEDMEIKAIFIAEKFTVRIKMAGEKEGQLLEECSVDPVEQIIDFGSTVNATAVAGPMYEFKGWYVGENLISSEASLAMEGAYPFTEENLLIITAVFGVPTDNEGSDEGTEEGGDTESGSEEDLSKSTISWDPEHTGNSVDPEV